MKQGPGLWKKRDSVFLRFAGLVSVILILVFGFILFTAVKIESFARESYGIYKENVSGPSASYNRVIFAAHRVITACAPLPEELFETLLDRKEGLCANLLGHASYAKKIDAALLVRILGHDPLFLARRINASNADYDAALVSLKAVFDEAVKTPFPADKAKLLEDFKAETVQLLSLLEARGNLLVQMEDYLFTVSKERSAQILRNSLILLFFFSVLILILGLAMGFYLRSLYRTRAELTLHRDHLSELVDRRTEELNGVNIRLRSEIDERKRIEDLLRVALKDKETLLKEVYHRIKNNLNMIVGLISLQKEGSTPEGRTGLENLENRISAIAMIHAKLYRSPDLSGVGLSEYLGDLAASLVRSLSSYSEGIRIECEVPEIKLPADTIIPLGLMVTEIITNAIKHGFRGRSGGVISIQGETGTEDFRLSIGNNGTPPESEDRILKSASLGAVLIQSFCAQLGGTFTLDISSGTKYIFHLPIKS
jgi:two-component sensor histidine kinase